MPGKKNMSLLSERWAYVAGATVVIWGAYFAWEKQKDGIVRTQRLPVVQKALAEAVRDGADATLCAEGGPFPYGERAAPVTAWVRLPNGLSECRTTVKPRSGSCFQCDELEKAGLVTRSEEHFADEAGNSLSSVVYRLSEDGRKVYYADIKTRSRAPESDCTPGEIKYVAPESAPSVSGRPGFCLGGGLRLLPITEYLAPARNGSRLMMSVRYQLEVLDPQPMLFEERMKPLFHELPKPGKPALYPPAITTAYFSEDRQKIDEFDPGLRYGEWLNQK